jgi:hypothetical protein
MFALSIAPAVTSSRVFLAVAVAGTWSGRGRDTWVDFGLLRAGFGSVGVGPAAAVVGGEEVRSMTRETGFTPSNGEDDSSITSAVFRRFNGSNGVGGVASRFRFGVVDLCGGASRLLVAADARGAGSLS